MEYNNKSNGRNTSVIRRKSRGETVMGVVEEDGEEEEEREAKQKANHKDTVKWSTVIRGT